MKKVILILIVSFAFLSAKTQVKDTVLTGQTVVASLGDTISVVDAITRNTVVTSQSGVSVVDEVFYVPTTAPNDTIYTLMAARTSGKKAAILFERGSERDTTITVSGDSLVFGAYGTGAKPVLSGFTEVTDWTQVNDTIWESTNAVSTLETMNMVVIGGVNTPMGRTPNSGYYYFQSSDGDTTITSTDLTGTPDWTGAEVAVNPTPWETKRCPITAQSGGTLTFTQPESFSILYNDLQFIIQNDIRTLDEQNEWYYNPSTKKISVYSTTEPTDVKVSTVADLVTVSDKDYITFRDIEFEGANNNTFYLASADNMTIDNCEINYSGETGVYGHFTGGDYLTVLNCTIDQTNDNAIGVWGDPLSPNAGWINATIRSNTVTNTGMIYGANRNQRGSTNNISALAAMGTKAAGATIEYNRIENTGYNGILFPPKGATVRYNYVRNFCRINHDGGGIMTNNGTAPDSVYSGGIVEYNVVVNDTSTTSVGIDNGIYLDDYSNGIIVRHNVISTPEDCGIYLHNTNNVEIRDNLAYNTYGLKISNDKYVDADSYENVVLKNNKFIAKNENQRLSFFDYAEKIIVPTFESDSNIFTKPFSESPSFLTYVRTPSFTSNNYTLDGWVEYSERDSNSTISAFPVASADSIFFVYNATTSTKDTTLSKTYLNVDGTAYSGTITLQPFTGVTLLDTTTYQQLLQSDILAYWNLDQNSATLDDAVGGNDLTNTGGVVNQTGKIGQAVQFDATSDYLSAAYSASLMPSGNEFTVNFWVKESTLTTGRMFAWRTAALTTPTYIRGWSSGAGVNGFVTNSGDSVYNVYTNTAIKSRVANTWHMITFVSNGTDDLLKMYIDATPAGVTTNAGFIGSLKKLTDGDITIGWSNGGPGIVGFMDEVGMWEKSLTQGEIRKLFESELTYPFGE